jgi:hypothetical protein
MKREIEEYLRARGVHYFRGHHDDEYFFLVDFVAGAYRGRLNVHLDVGDAGPDTVAVTISPDRYYSVEKAEQLGAVVDRWNGEDPAVRAVVHGSCDPHLIGVCARSQTRPADMGALAGFVDAAVAAGIDLFGRIAVAATPPGTALRDAG